MPATYRIHRTESSDHTIHQRKGRTSPTQQESPPPTPPDYARNFGLAQTAIKNHIRAGPANGVSWVVELTPRAGLQPRAQRQPKRKRAPRRGARGNDRDPRGRSADSPVGSRSLFLSRDTHQRAGGCAVETWDIGHGAPSPRPAEPQPATIRQLLSRAWRRRRDGGGRRSSARSPDVAWERRVETLETRLEHLEAELEGLQDAVYRQAVLEDEHIDELRRRTAPEQLARDLSRDARRRGV
jgi:hypothetical protein